MSHRYVKIIYRQPGSGYVRASSFPYQFGGLPLQQADIYLVFIVEIVPRFQFRRVVCGDRFTRLLNDECCLCRPFFHPRVPLLLPFIPIQLGLAEYRGFGEEWTSSPRLRYRRKLIELIIVRAN